MSTLRACIIVTCRDLGRYLSEAVESALVQTRPADRLLVVDDGSRDVFTLQELARLEQDGIEVLRLDGRGVALARNEGASRLNQETLLFLDADDRLSPTHLETTLALLESEEALDFVSGSLEAFGESHYRWTPPALTPLDVLVAGGPHISTLMRRRMWHELGGFDPALPAYEDTDLWLRALESGFRGRVLPDVLLHHRVRQGSRYHRAVGGKKYAKSFRALVQKHRAVIDSDPRAFLQRRERFLQELRGHRDNLIHQQGGHESQLVDLYAERRELVAALSGHGQPPITTGEVLRKDPISPVWGVDRGLPLDRLWVESFLDRNRQDIHGRVLEVKDAGYSRMFGDGEIDHIDVVDVDPTRPEATIFTDLCDAQEIPSASYDAFLLTQTLHLLAEPLEALRHAYRALKPGGVLLCTLPAASRISFEDRGLDGDYWRFTGAGARELFSQVFPPDQFEVETHGNLYAMEAFLLGLGPSDVDDKRLKVNDPSHPLLVCVRAVRPRNSPAETPAIRQPEGSAVVLAWHRIASFEPDPHGLCVGQELFVDQIEALTRRFDLRPLEELLESALRGRLPERALALTFDDATKDHLQTVAPFLESKDLPAIFFAVGEALDSEGEAWWDLLVRSIYESHAKRDLLTIELEEDRRIDLPLTPGPELDTTFRTLHGALIDASILERDRLLGQILTSLGHGGSVREDREPLRSLEVRELAQIPGMRIGNHTRHHLRLPCHPIEVQADEIFGGRLAIERVTGESCRVLAYPYGESSEESRRAAAASEHLGAVTVEPERLDNSTDRFATPRLEVGPWPADELVARIENLLRA